MELVACDVDLGHFSICHNDPFRVGVAVQFTPHAQSGVSGGGADQIDNHAIADQRFGTPVHGDEREQPVLDFIPLAGPWRQVMDPDIDAEFVGGRCNSRFHSRTREPLLPPPSAVIVR